jgi:RNA polymerase sigma-70 factor, ECF subfamily
VRESLFGRAWFPFHGWCRALPTCQDRVVTAQDDLERLAEAAAHGDNTAVAELVRRTQPVVWRVCSALGSPGEVEDLVQETYLRALRSLPKFRGDAPVTGWLAAVARNVCADHVRGRTRLGRLVDRLCLEPIVEHFSDAPGSVADLLSVLDTDRREAFVLTQLAGLSYEEAAAAMGCPVGTIRSRVARARGQLLDAARAADAN